MKNRGGAAFISMLLTLLAFVWFIFNYQTVIDQIVVSQFKPSTAIASLMNSIQFTQKGKNTFLAAQPELNESKDFNKHCDKKTEQTVVLGCYIGPQHIYIYNVTDPRLSGVRQVTAAHEMLHVAYDRLSYSEKKHVNRMVENALPQVEKSQPDLADRLKVYDKTEPGERNNELHSILGTEATGLPSDLESYYKQYFTNRSIITNFAAGYDKVFEEVKQEQNALVAELNTLAKEIDTLTQEYNSQSKQLNKDIETFNTQANQEGGFSSDSEFNSARSELIVRRDALEAKRNLINSKVDEYDKKRAELDAVNVKVQELNNKIDSSSVPSI